MTFLYSSALYSPEKSTNGFTVLMGMLLFSRESVGITF